jgi:hypothetical protein
VNLLLAEKLAWEQQLVAALDCQYYIYKLAQLDLKENIRSIYVSSMDDSAFLNV